MTKSAENIEKKIEAQLEKLKQLKAQKQAIEAREKTKQKEQERKDDTRRKILLGSYLIKKMNANEANKEKILAELNEYLTEDRDRQLFNLLPIKEAHEKNYDNFEKEFKSREQANNFLKNHVEHLNVLKTLKESKGVWIIRVMVEEFSDEYIELADVFYNPSYEELHTDDEDDGEEWEPDFDSDRKVTDVGLNGYPSGYDTSLTNRY